MKKTVLSLLLSGLSACFLKVCFAEEGAAQQAHQTLTTLPNGQKEIKAEVNEEEDEFIEDDLNDPLEPVNRVIYVFNSVFDAFITKPLAILYRGVLPDEARNGVGNFFSNLASPVTFLNHVLQGELGRAGTTLARFGLNTTLGIGGFFDPAKKMGFHTLETNFNETMGVWGFNTGPYLVLPVIGPSSFRGALGLGADCFTQPLNYYVNSKHDNEEIAYTLTGVQIIHQRNLVLESIDNLEATSLDMYASLRAIYFDKQKYRLDKLKENDESKANDEILDAPTTKEIFG